MGPRSSATSNPKPVLVPNLICIVPRGDAGQHEAASCLVESEKRQARQKRIGSARPADARRACACGADEIDLLHKHSRAVLLPEENDARHHVIEQPRAERAGPTRRGARVVARADQIDVALAVDLTAAEKEGIDPSLGGAVEELAAAVGEEVVPGGAKDRDPHRRLSAFRVDRAAQHRARGGNRRGGADRNVVDAGEELGDRGDEPLAVARRPHANAAVPVKRWR